MNEEEFFTFKIGDFKCIAVSDGSLIYAPPTFPPPVPFLFPNAPKERLEQVLSEYNIEAKTWTGWLSPYICLVINTDKHTVLVDTGAGNLAPSTGKLCQNLKTSGVSPNDIDTVILTHGHPDHIGGNITSEGTPTFPNARFVMWKNEWDFWTSEHVELKPDDESMKFFLTFARKNLLPLQGKLNLIDTEEEILPGISAITAPGHTLGHMALAVSSNSEQVLVVSDAFLHSIHIEYPEWFAAIDSNPEQVVNTRHRLLNLATEKQTIVFAFHFPFPGLGRIVQKRERWQWQPLDRI